MKKIFVFKIFVLPVLILLQACGGDDGGSGVEALKAPTPGFAVFWGSCDNSQAEAKTKFSESAEETPKTCREWYGGFFANINLSQACASVPGGNLSEDHCSELDVLGLCSVPIGIESETRYFYYQSQWSLSEATKDCESKDVNAQWLDLSAVE